MQNDAFIGKKVIPAKTARMTNPIQTLDVTRDGFYSFIPTDDNTAKVVLTRSKDHGLPYLDHRELKALAVHYFKASATLMYADMRGVYLEYWGPDLDCRKNFTLHVKWKELGVDEPKESHFQLFLDFIKSGILERHFMGILLKGNKCRKAIMRALESIQVCMHERYHVGRGYFLETSVHGAWNLCNEHGLKLRDLCLAEITINCVIGE